VKAPLLLLMLAPEGTVHEVTLPQLVVPLARL
jgi:hypothetical protein